MAPLADLARTIHLENIGILVGALAGLALLYVAWQTFYNVYLHPLSKFPGPRLAGAGRLWYSYYFLKGDMPFVVHELHKQYGDVVRVAPDELSFVNADAWNQIYGHRPGKPELQKDPGFYGAVSSPADSILRVSRDRHSYMRKQMSHGFSERALRDQEGAIRQYANLFVGRLKENCAQGKPIQNIVKWFNFFTFDVMGDLVFGESFDCLQESGYHPWVQLLFDSVKVSAWVRCASFWPVLTPFLSFFIPKDIANRRKEHHSFSKIKALQRQDAKTERLDLISGLLKPDTVISQAEYEGTVQTMILAGSETTATLMSGVTNLLLANPDKMKKVVAEVRSSFETEEEINFTSVNKLDYLLACLNEGLRMYPPAPDAFPRRTGEQPETICGNTIPSNTTVKVTQWATFRSESNFTKPNEFIPERWLENTDEKATFQDDKKYALQPFSVGPRNCLGRNLAYVEMRLLMAMLLWNFDLEVMEESKNWSDQKVYVLWEKPSLTVKLTPRALQDGNVAL
ncbi:hypothetical protein MBLNU459_g4991t2 [Dothideomycetes sp. NU459]